MCGLNQFSQVTPRHGLAASQVEMENSQVSGFLKHADPIVSWKFRLSSNHLQRIRAIDAVQRTAMRDFRNQR
jgi:hypothetical protein